MSNTISPHVLRVVEAVEKGDGEPCDHCHKSTSQCGACNMPEFIYQLIEERRGKRKEA